MNGSEPDAFLHQLIELFTMLGTEHDVACRGE